MSGVKERFDCVVAVRTYEKDGETKKVWTNVGSVVLFDDGGGILELDAIPAPEANREGKLKFIARLFGKQQRDGGGRRQRGGGGFGGGGRQQQPSGGDDFGGGFGNDDIPF